MMIHDTLSREKVALEPIDPPLVRMYACGPTVYDSPHVGHARSAVAFDVARRYLEYKGYDVIFTRNYTDVDDKMIDRANERGINIQALARQYIDEYEQAMAWLNVKPPVYAPRATHLIDDFVGFIQALVENGSAYEVNGNVYFHVPAFKRYGMLSVKPEKEMADVLGRDSSDHASEKRDPRDFALWKREKEGEPSWESPWGKGRPGWHVECSVMSMKFLGETIDIHGGGRDLIFPHHENEIAQSESRTGKPFCKIWMHNGFVTVDKEKMSKSLDNFFTVKDVIAEIAPPALRMFLVSAHYRNPIDFSKDLLDQATKTWERARDAWMLLAGKVGKDMDALDQVLLDTTMLPESIARYLDEFEEAMDDDFSTPRALAAMHSLIRHVNATLREGSDTMDPSEESFHVNNAFKVLEVMLGVLGLDRAYIMEHAGGALGSRGGTGASVDPGSSVGVTAVKGVKLEPIVGYLLELRARAREQKDWATADEIRNMLKDAGIGLEDAPGGGTSWKIEGT
ncbi:cysteine--tRNA ligase [Candidatus Bathyarchaeota archaeon]|nr:cysteine--tRNA ligase [Candidatus Bathyarchaeota archaeon]